ncbi:PP2C family protein-serine/threonine phosphatase [Capillimicrobium parvum]|uniref:PP2C-family Ser/Thr phosphatase n=1 Tax=Capillimicrobium parvum TaxID=2884022 RepID=A0A9E7C1L5_9ACTN|nr:protein phosphatase 2C domain-containing protein [Capillimicrobium parvum]UGS36553.1 PP2C-family Ser/Thr phosphatase [Capillimicrobium parvum]
MPTLTLECAVRSAPGPRRTHNEDAVFASPRMIAVADGVGGHAAGEVASRAVIDALAHLEKCRLQAPLPDALEAAVARGNDAIAFIAECRPPASGMSTTLTAVALEADYTVANIGDSRAYLYRDGRLVALTRDDSYVQALVDAGHLTAEAARAHPQRNVVLAALDGAAERRPTISRHAARPGDRLLLCSDGLTDVVSEDEVRAALEIAARDRCADRLIALARDAGGRDDLTVVVADVAARPGPDSIWA